MDPLSVSASVIAVLQLTISLMKYVNDIRNATSEQKLLAVEAGNLYGLLTDLRFRVEEGKSDDPWFQQVKALNVKDGPLDQLKNLLEGLLRYVPRGSSTRSNIKTRLTWKWVKTDVDHALQQIERIKSLISIALANDNFKLSQVIHRDVTNLVAQTLELRTGIETLKDKAAREQLSKIRDWLNVPDSSSNYQAALERRHPHTGLWLLASTQYEEWKKAAPGLLWIQGSAGSGKTILSATALQEIFDEAATSDAIVTYFYFDFNSVEKQRSQNATRSLLFQLSSKLPRSFDSLRDLYQRCDDGKQEPSKDSVQSLLLAALSSPVHKYIILDALDECVDRIDLLSFLPIMLAPQNQQTHMLVTSRRERDIEDVIKPISTQTINVGSDTSDRDIQMYINHRLSMDQRLRKWPDPVKHEIDLTLMSKAHGMFRWVHCQLDALCRCIKLNDLRRSLSSLPKSLDETYARIVQQIESDGYLSDAINALRWLCFAARPLGLMELVEALALEDGTGGGFSPDERIPDPEDVRLVCSSLITCEGTENDDHLNPEWTVQLAHLSVKEYLLSERFPSRSHLDACLCHQALAEGCLYYLIYVHDTHVSPSTVFEDYPLLRYAARYWYEHAKQMGPITDSTTLMLTKRLFSCAKLRFKCAVQSRVTGLFVFDPDRVDPHKPPTWCSPLYYVASLGLTDIVASILNDNNDICNQGEYLGGALAAASHAGFVDVVQLLLDKGADVLTPFSYWGDILCIASVRGYLNIVDVLLRHGADVNGPGGYRGSALCIASYYGYEEVVKTLLSHGADINNSTGRLGAALHVASRRDNQGVVRILLDRGANINTSQSMGKTALFIAVSHGHKQVVKILLERGADIDWHEKTRPALYQAIVDHRHEIVQILLEGGADINIRTDKHADALQLASSTGNETIVRMLLEKGADVNKEGGRYGTALQVAASEGKNGVVRILLEHSADPNSRGGSLGSPLGAAVSTSTTEVVKTLLASGAEVDSRPKTLKGFHDTALYTASVLGHTDIIALLLDNGADINGEGGSLGPALIAASKKCKFDAVRVLLERGANVNIRSNGGRYRTAVQAARSARGGEDVVHLLLRHGATED